MRLFRGSVRVRSSVIDPFLPDTKQNAHLIA